MQDQLRIFTDIENLITLSPAAQKGGRRIHESDLGEIKKAALVCKNGRVLWRGPEQDLTAKQIQTWSMDSEPETVSLKGQTVLPAFTECHTHLIFAGDRSQEFEWRQQGQTYQEISAKGGGILSTVRSTRSASEEELLQSGQRRIRRFIEQGVTAVEVKSGYGLDLETELKCLRVAGRLRDAQILRTYLGAHSRSPDYPDLESYLSFMLDQVLPMVAREKLADRVDIYIERGFYDLNMARAYFAKAKQLGLPLTAHVEQLSALGGTELTLEFLPQSVDHVVYLEASTIQKIAQSNTVAVLLPASDFYLKMKYPPARELIDAGARVALSTDFNPGTSPTQDLSLVGALARIEMKMTLPEVIAAWTIGSAAALGLDSDRGSLCEGKTCDFIVLDCDWRQLFYSVGNHPVQQVYRKGLDLTNP